MSEWNKKKTIAQEPSFTQCFDGDFLEVTKALRPGYVGDNYAFMRFADGEAAIMQGKNHKAKSDKWQASEVHHKWRTYLTGSIRLMRDLEFVTGDNPIRLGLSAEGHHGRAAHNWLLDQAIADYDREKFPMDRVTFAEIFCFANYERTKDWDLSDYRLVHQNAEDERYRCPATAVVQDWPLIPFVRGLLDDSDTRPILVSSGPVSKAIIAEFVRMTFNQYEKAKLPATIIDVGSAIDPITRGRPTRRFHRGVDADWVPMWESEPEVPVTRSFAEEAPNDDDSGQHAADHDSQDSD